ncbi:helix-hairpin-helix domain-containing protein [Leucobacter musarum]|uniref:helix-hairpin-helix domain-containing protein n=1 Tax=Leucobacter musarum TaxID=1930747 RepID=UPI0009E8664D|nr:helix-hairpin-helix domain-containing protein [Leucobacter musarum]
MDVEQAGRGAARHEAIEPDRGRETQAVVQDTVPVEIAHAWTSERVLERGHWARDESSGLSSIAAPGPLAWEPATRIRDRLKRAVALPVLVGVVVFVAAVAVAIGITMARGHAVPDDAASFDTDLVAGENAGDGGSDEDSRTDGVIEPGGGATGARSSNGADSAATGGRVTLHVVGAVSAAGVVELPEGARVSDAIAAAGGATEAAQLDAVNLARTVVDGEQIVVPDAALAAIWAEQGAGGLSTGQSSAAEAPAGAGGPAGASASAGKMSLNSATVADLETLPRIGPALAQRIVDWREANGGFGSVDELLEVSGIGAKTLEGFRDLVVP